MRTLQFKKISLMICSMLCACVMQAQSVEFIRENIPGIGVNKTVINNNGELLLAGIRGGNPSVMKMDTLGNVIWHKTFYDEPVRNNSNNQWHFWDLRADDENNIYLYTEEINTTYAPPPRVIKLNDNGELVWASDDLPPAFEFESHICTWLHIGDTSLTVCYMDIASRVHLTTGEVLGKDSTLSEFWIENCLNDIVFEGKHYRGTEGGFLVFDESGGYEFEAHPLDLIYSVRHVDSTGYYFLLRTYLDSVERKGKLPQLQHYDEFGNLTREKFILRESYFNAEDSLDNSNSVSGYLFHPKKGIIIRGSYRHKFNPETQEYENWGGVIYQIRPSDFKILYDTAFEKKPELAVRNLFYKDNTIFIQGYRSYGGVDANIMKLNLKDVDDYPASSVTEKQQKTNAIKIYPNPSSTGEFIIQSQNQSIIRVDVFTMTGQVVYSQKVNALQETLQMDTKGIYLVRVTTDDNQTETLKIVNQ